MRSLSGFFRYGIAIISIDFNRIKKFVKGLTSYYQQMISHIVVSRSSFQGITDQAQIIETIFQGMQGGCAKKVRIQSDFSSHTSRHMNFKSKDPHSYHRRLVWEVLQNLDGQVLGYETLSGRGSGDVSFQFIGLYTSMYLFWSPSILFLVEDVLFIMSIVTW